jgi:hypothetical protein
VPAPILTVVALSAFLDLFLAVYPGVMMWKLQIAQRKKIGLITAFSLGAW